MNKIFIFSLKSAFGSRENYAKRVIKKSLKALKKDKIYLEIYFIGSREMKFLNKKFRGKNKDTNILSFKEPGGFPHPELKFRNIGEIYLNLEQISDYGLRTTIKNKKAASRNLWPMDYLLIHGLLHLLSYTHDKKGDTMIMEKMEKRLLKFLITNS